jgi:hypothetical protein
VIRPIRRARRPRVRLGALLAAAAGGACAGSGAGDGGDRATAQAAPPTSAAATAVVACDGSGLARTCTVAGLFADAPATRVTLTTGEGVPDTLVVALARAGAPVVRLPTFYGSRLWGQCGPATDERDLPRRDRLAVADVDGDGASDLIVLAECMTGIGPTGAQPFPAGAVYLADGQGGWRSREPVDSALTDLAQGSCGEVGDGGGCDVRALAREAVRRAGR